MRCSALILPEPQIFKGFFLPCCCHQNSNYMQAGKMYTFSSNTVYDEQLYKDLMSWLLPWICWCSCFSCYCLFKPSWIKRTVFIFTAWCCIISIIQKPCAHNLILSIIFMAAEHAQENVETLAFLSPLYIICVSFIINLVDLVGGKKTMFVVHVRIQIKLLYSNLLENTELYTVEHGDTYCGHQRAPMHYEKMGVPVKESKKKNANEFSCHNGQQLSPKQHNHLVPNSLDIFMHCSWFCVQTPGRLSRRLLHLLLINTHGFPPVPQL